MRADGLQDARLERKHECGEPERLAANTGTVEPPLPTTSRFLHVTLPAGDV